MRDIHPRCLERLACPCWREGATEEAKIHTDRITTRPLTDYIRALGDTDPTLTTREIANRIYAVYGDGYSIKSSYSGESIHRHTEMP